MAQRTGEKKFVAAKNIAIFSQKLCKLCIINRGQNITFVFMQNQRSFPAKMSTFIAFYGTKFLGENDKIFKNSHKNCFCFFGKKWINGNKFNFAIF